ncbi:MAG: CHASE2 domain-containing protein [Planctomycetes bacterium]|nr:CHASE2 domain-containing protein [Planctomycetota bacterium]
MIGIDAATVAELGPLGPGYRRHHGRLIERLEAAGARGVAFDLWFPEVTGEATEAMARAAEGARIPVVVGVRTVEPEAGRLEALASDRRLEGRPNLGRGALAVQPELVLPDGLEAAQEALDRARPGDPPPSVSLADGEVVVLARAAGLRPLVEELALRAGVLGEGGLDGLDLLEPVAVELGLEGGRRLVLRTEAALRPRVGDPAGIPTLGYSQVLAGDAGAEALAGALVLVGLTHGLRDVVPRPDPVAAPTTDGLHGVYLQAFALRRVVEEAGRSPRGVPGRPARRPTGR